MHATTYKRYMLWVLMVILASSYMDRYALGLVLQDIKHEFHASDTQLGVLTGLAFAIFYSLMGIPLARWADRDDRVRIISITIAVWSVAVVLSGTVTNFVQLLLVRTVVAVGEAGCLPPAHSLIADTFDRGDRPRAVATYMLGSSLSVTLGYFVAGWLNELYGWRATFMILGVPGVALAVLAWGTLREPRRGMSGSAAASVGNPSLWQVGMALWNNRTFRHLLFCFSVASFFGYGILQWLPAFFLRSYGFQTRELGAWFTLVYGAAGLLGTFLGGQWAARYAARNERLQLKVMAAGYASFGIISAFIYLSSNRYVSLGLLAVATLGSATTAGPMFATIQTLVPQRMRATSIALIYLFGNLVGMGLGPLLAGALSDGLRPRFGDESLRYALLSLCPGYLWVGAHVWRASTTVVQDLEVARVTPAMGRSSAMQDTEIIDA
jgi:MFS family permease